MMNIIGYSVLSAIPNLHFNISISFDHLSLHLYRTLFFNGIMGQVKKAFTKERRIQTITILGTLLLIVILGFTAKNAWVCIILMLSQFSAIFAYAGTMIPGCKKYLCCCCRLAGKGATAGAAAVV